MIKFMWSKDEIYENRFGKCAYLAGVIRVIGDTLAMATAKAGVKFETLASDVFCMEGNKESVINDLVRERLEKLIREEFCDERNIKLSTNRQTETRGC